MKYDFTNARLCDFEIENACLRHGAPRYFQISNGLHGDQGRSRHASKSGLPAGYAVADQPLGPYNGVEARCTVTQLEGGLSERFAGVSAGL